ncbi:MAG: DUF5018 domain-containing protein [Breznakibacter sp.]
MKNKILFLFTLIFAFAISSCEDPEYVVSNAQRQGITSIDAYFTSGQYNNMLAGRLQVTNPDINEFVIPIPYFYPETSDEETTNEQLANMRVKVEIDNNCIIKPGVAILDLIKENKFTFVDNYGKSRQVTIRGERIKSDKCELIAFGVNEPAISGIIDKAAKKVSIISAEDLSAVLCNYELSAHATITPDPATTPVDLNEPCTFTVVAHNGVTKCEYTVVKEVPAKLPSGFDKNSLEQLFNFDPVSMLGLPNFKTSIGPSMAMCGGNLVVCLGDGKTPIYLNRSTGVKLGTINQGSAPNYSVTSDDAENMLLVNKANGGEIVKIYKTSSVNDDPTPFYSFTNPSAFLCGAKMKVNGNINGDALIVLTNAGIDGVSACSEAIIIQVVGGVVIGHQIIDLSSVGQSWGSAPVNTATVVAASTNPADGVFQSNYGASTLNWILGNGSVVGSFNSDLTGWAMNPNCLDAKTFNNTKYMSLFVVSHFPAWGMGPQLFLYDVSSKNNFTGSNVGNLDCLVLKNDAINWYQTASYSVASGDVILAPSKDGYKMYIYYYDHNSGVIGGYSVDCIDRSVK